MADNQTRIGVISYSTMVRRDFNLGSITEAEEMLDIIWEIEYMAGVTNTADGILEMQAMFTEYVYTRLVLLCFDHINPFLYLSYLTRASTVTIKQIAQMLIFLNYIL